MESKEVNITYETLFEILKRERDLADLQKLEPGFYNDFVEYLNDKKKIFSKEDTLFSYEEKKKVEKQIDNAKRIVKEIYERREKKILNIALIKSRTKSNVIDTSSMLENEKKFLNHVENVLNLYRKDVISKVIDGNEVFSVRKDMPKAEEKKMNEPMADVKADEPDKSESVTKLVRFLHSVPKFVGEELEEYGPFEEEDIANLPTKIADVLIGKERVEEIKGS